MSVERRTFLTALAAARLPWDQLHADPAPSPAAQFKLGLVTWNLASGWDLATLLKVCKTVGLAAVELRTTHAHGVEPFLSKDQRAEVRKRIEDSGVTLWGLGTTCEFHSPSADEVAKQTETCKRFLELAADLGAKGVKVRPNALPKEVPVEKTLEQIGKALIPCGKTAADLNQEVWVEVHGPGTSAPRHMKTIMEHCGSPSVGVTWNSNGTDVVNGSVAESFTLLRPWIKSCHINELFGPYPYRELFAKLREMSYDRVTLIELPQKLDPGPGELLLKYYRALWAELCH